MDGSAGPSMRIVVNSVLFFAFLNVSVSPSVAASQSESPSIAPSDSAARLKVVADLAKREVPWLAKSLVFEAIPKVDGKDVFELRTQPGKLIISASDVPSAAAGLNYYLKYFCHRSMSHVGNNLAPVASLPMLRLPVRRVSPFKYRYLLNYCTLNYTLSFADWERWQRELDWMALNGVNLALATTGTEAVWQNTLRRMGYSEAEILDFIPGPAYTAWWLMGNLEGWGGPVTQRMIDDRVALEKKIVARMRELGTEPVMQGFYGMVPASLSQKFPQARILEQGGWGGFRRPKILLSSDPLFARMAAIYYEEINKLYGPVRFYGGDLFHEGGITTGLDLASLGRGVQDSMLKANAEAVWVLQGWQGNPKQQLLDGLLRPHTLIINMESDDWEKRAGFGGIPWIWGIINNFGENTGMFGPLPRVASEPWRAITSPYGPSMAGLGALMEGIDNNPVVYDLLFDVAWRSEPARPEDWIKEYVRYRYGQSTPEVERAWQLLLETVYKSGNRAEPIFCARPSLSVKSVSTWGPAEIKYDPAKLEEAAGEFLKASDQFGKNDAYQYDAVNLVRQVLASRGMPAYHAMIDAYNNHNASGFDAAANKFLGLIRTEDKLLSTRREFLLGTWLADARAMGHDDAEKDLCERNARTQITFWGPDDPKTELHEYAHKEWSGLMRDFYLRRWEMFVAALRESMSGKRLVEPDYFAFEKNWTEEHKAYSAMPSGDPLAEAAKALAAARANDLRR